MFFAIRVALSSPPAYILTSSRSRLPRNALLSRIYVAVNIDIKKNINREETKVRNSYSGLIDRWLEMSGPASIPSNM